MPSIWVVPQDVRLVPFVGAGFFVFKGGLYENFDKTMAKAENLSIDFDFIINYNGFNLEE